MATAGLFQASLDSVDPQRVLRTESKQHQLARMAAAAAPPTNQQILDAAKALYRRNQPLVDLNATTGTGYVKSAPGKSNVATLNAYNWKSQLAAPITPAANSVFTSAAMATPVAAAKDSGNIAALSIGISEVGQIIIGEEGGIGIVFALDSSGVVKGFGTLAGRLGLDIEVSLNLQLGLWSVPPAELAGNFVGLEVSVDVEVALSMGIYMDAKTLSMIGITVGIGAGLGGGASIVGGHTWIF